MSDNEKIEKLEDIDSEKITGGRRNKRLRTKIQHVKDILEEILWKLKHPFSGKKEYLEYKYGNLLDLLGRRGSHKMPQLHGPGLDTEVEEVDWSSIEKK